MHRDAQAISDAAKAKGVGNDNDPYVPSLLDIHCAYLLNSPVNGVAAAVAVILAQRNDQDAAKSFTDVVTGILAADQISALYKTRGKYLGTSTAPNTVAKFVAAVDAELSDALKKAYELMQQSAPEELMQVKGTRPPGSMLRSRKSKRTSGKTIRRRCRPSSAISARPVSGLRRRCCPGAARLLRSACRRAETRCRLPRHKPGAGSNGASDFEIGSQDIPQGAVVVISPIAGHRHHGACGVLR